MNNKFSVSENDFIRACRERLEQSPSVANGFFSPEEQCRGLLATFPKMKSHLHGEGLDPEAVDEIYSQVLEAVWKGLEKYENREKAKLSTWAWSIMINKTIDFYRSKDRAKAILFTDIPPSQRESDGAIEESIAMFLFRESTPEDESETEELIEILNSKLKTDPTGCARLALEIWYWNGPKFRIKDLAQKYGIKPNTLTQRLRRCREPIQKMLEE